jgi:hypothetical protein
MFTVDRTGSGKEGTTVTWMLMKEVCEDVQEGNDRWTAFGYLQHFVGSLGRQHWGPVRTSGREAAKKDVVLFTHLPDLVSRLACRTRLMGRNSGKEQGVQSGSPCQTFL